jgi:hypothetical protein
MGGGWATRRVGARSDGKHGLPIREVHRALSQIPDVGPQAERRRAEVEGRWGEKTLTQGRLLRVEYHDLVSDTVGRTAHLKVSPVSRRDLHGRLCRSRLKRRGRQGVS